MISSPTMAPWRPASIVPPLPRSAQGRSGSVHQKVTHLAERSGLITCASQSASQVLPPRALDAHPGWINFPPKDPLENVNVGRDQRYVSYLRVSTTKQGALKIKGKGR